MSVTTSNKFSDGKRTYEVKRELAQTAILKGCGGDITKVEPLVAKAKKTISARDYSLPSRKHLFCNQ